MIRVVVTGSECTGKTMLAEALAVHYGTACVPEFARQFVIDKGAAPDYPDVDAIAHGQITIEDAAVDDASEVMVQDTDLLSTIVYSRHYYGDVPDWIEVAFQKRVAELYLLTDIDVPWVADGQQRDRGTRREEMHELFRRALLDRRLRFVEIHGSTDGRLEAAIAAIGERAADIP